MRHWIKNSCLVVLGLIGFKTTNANAAVEMVLCINGVAGSTTNSKSDTGCIDVLAWSWGVSNSSMINAGGIQIGKANFQDISITKFADNTSTYLLKAVASGKSQPAIQLRVRKSCGVPDCPGPMLQKLTLGPGSLISSVSTGGSGGEDHLTENISVAFPDIEWCYAVLDPVGQPTANMDCESWTIVTGNP